jgi:ribosome recycling factor
MPDSGIDAHLSNFETKMKNSIIALTREFQGIRTSRASVGLLDTVKVDVYGSFAPIQNVGTISVPDARMLVVQVWNKEMVKLVEKAIRESDLGLNPLVDGQLIRISIPPLNKERRQELAKIASRYAEDCKVTIRNVRRDALELFKRQEKSKEITEDELHRVSDAVQKLTDLYVKEIENILAKKQNDIMSI